jgi:transaldolase/glucose-6-phosphate isomerase
MDYIRRSLITSGELKHLVEEDGLSGVTSNPTIFQKAIAGSLDYDETIRKLLAEYPNINVRTLFEKLLIEDILMVADVLRPVYDRTDGTDGFVNIELSPELSHDTNGSIIEARRLWKEINRPNVMIKVPATNEGVPAIETLTAEGINVNITLMFSISQYESVANAYIRGLERCTNPEKISSVASFFLSRIDTVVDKRLEEIATSEALALRGKAAIVTAKIVYRRFQEIFSGERWEKISRRGARVQRVLWASTGTKNPTYSNVHYIEPLIGPNTINTMPISTFNAFRDHGHVKSTIGIGLEEAKAIFKKLGELKIDLDAEAEKLQVDGIAAFTESYEGLLNTLKEKTLAITRKIDLHELELGKFQEKVDRRLEQWNMINFMRRIWARDPTLWSSEPIPEVSDRLGWLTLPEIMHDQIKDFTSFAGEVKSEGTRHVVLLGMGGSSLAPEVYQNVFGNKDGFPKLMVLDSTHPSAIKDVEKRIVLQKTLFLVSSKSGTTMETLSLFYYFWNKVKGANSNAGRQFVAITDQGTFLDKMAKERNFRKIFRAPLDVGGRYSALTAFGLLPAALIGVDIHSLLDDAWTMSENCAFCVPADKASCSVLGAALGELAREGMDKVTFITSPSIKSFPVWLEQLIAESTGKDGRGIIPIVDEPLTDLRNYGEDRFFVFFLNRSEGLEPRELMSRLEASGHPIIRIDLNGNVNISQEIFCWEMAVASAGTILGVNPFNQPDVQGAKDLAKEMMEKAKNGELGDAYSYATSIQDLDSLLKALKVLLSQANKGDYVAIQAFLPSSDETSKALQRLRSEILNRLHLATMLGYGPRYLHSTGQLHKGGPKSGIFLQIVNEYDDDLEVPETEYTFGTLIQAQALGEYQTLKRMGRRILCVNLKKGTLEGLFKLTEMIGEVDVQIKNG